MKSSLFRSIIILITVSIFSAQANETATAENEGLVAIYQGNYPLAESYFLKKVKEPDSKNQALIHLSWIYLSKGETQQTIDYIEQAMQVQPNDVDELLLDRKSTRLNS